MEFDAFLNRLGQFGLYQKRICFLLCISTIPVAFQKYLHVFILAVPEHRCALPTLWNDTYEVQSLRHLKLINRTIPVEHTTTGMEGQTGKLANIYDACTIYAEPGDTYRDVKTHMKEGRAVRPCKKWVYRGNNFVATAVTKLDMVCRKRNYPQFLRVSFLTGAGIGAVTIGVISDRFGRRKGLYLSLLIHLVSSFSMAWTPNFVIFILLHLMTGFSVNGMFLSGYVTAIELVSPAKRLYPAMLISLSHSTGIAVLACLAYLLTDWRLLAITTSVATSGLLLYWWLIPESPRWLITVGQCQKANQVISIMADVNSNQMEVSKITVDDIGLAVNKSAAVTKGTHFFASKNIQIIALCVNWFLLNSTPYQNSDIISFHLTGCSHPSAKLGALSLLDTVACGTCFLLLRCLVQNRKPIYLVAIIIFGLVTLGALFIGHTFTFYIEQEMEWSKIGVNVIGRLSTTTAVCVLSLITVEMVPTCRRSSGLGLVLLAGYLGKLTWLTVVISRPGPVITKFLVSGMSVMCIILSGLLVHLVPETCGTYLKDLSDQSRDFNRKESVLDGTEAQIKAEGSNSEDSTSCHGTTSTKM